MKRVISILLAIIMVVSLAACGGEETAEKDCPNCGKSIREFATFCDHCGAKVENGDKKESLFGDVEVGDCIKFGNYNNSDIEWLVLEKTDSRVLVVSKNAVHSQAYNDRNAYITWETCALRLWLNDYFINSAFSDEEREMIPTVTVTADPNPKHDTDPGNNTEDRVFLLSIKEVNEYFASDVERICYDAEGFYCSWWLRSPGYRRDSAAIVDSDGNVLELGENVRRDNAVRPAMWIEIE